MPNVVEVEQAIEALSPRQLLALRRRLSAKSEDLADLLAHRAALKEADFTPWADVKKELHALHGPARRSRKKVS